MPRIDPDSRVEVIAVWVVVILICAALFLVNWRPVIKAILIGGLVFLAVFNTYFFRLPTREALHSDHVVTSSADGEVVIVEKVFEKEFLKRDCIQVSVYMDFFNVHANYWPISGDITYYKYHPGRYLLAFLPKSSEKNEHSSTCVHTPDGKDVLFKQIAGTFARRIVSYSNVGDHVLSGDQCGIIKFGSRLDIFLPLDADVKVNVGDKVRACVSVIAEI